MAVQQLTNQSIVLGKTVNIIFFMFSPCAENKRTTGDLSVGVDP